MEFKMTKKSHGGARPGAGRKPVDTVERRVRLPRDVVSILTALGNGRLSTGITLAARQHSALWHSEERLGVNRERVDTVEHRVRLPRDVVSILTALGNGRLSAGIIKAARQLKIGLPL